LMTADEPLSETILNCIKVLEMVAILHQRGYELMRIEPGMSPSGMSWRCGITHAENMDPDNGILSVNSGDQEMALYTSAAGDEHFGWPDAPGLDTEHLADRFLLTYPEICKLGQGKDPEYVTWYELMLSFAGTGELPYAYDDYGDYDDEPPGFIPTMGESNGKLPIPPLCHNHRGS
jgi:hypothetical protein